MRDEFRDSDKGIVNAGIARGDKNKDSGSSRMVVVVQKEWMKAGTNDKNKSQGGVWEEWICARRGVEG